MRRLQVLVAGLVVLVAAALVLLLVPANVHLSGRLISCGSVTFVERFGPAVVRSATVPPPGVAAASGACDRALGHRTATGVTAGLLGVMGLLGVAMATGVLRVDQDHDGQDEGSPRGAAPAAGTAAAVGQREG